MDKQLWRMATGYGRELSIPIWLPLCIHVCIITMIVVPPFSCPLMFHAVMTIMPNAFLFLSLSLSLSVCMADFIPGTVHGVKYNEVQLAMQNF